MAIIILCGRYHHLHVINEETEAQRCHSAGERQKNDWNRPFLAPPHTTSLPLGSVLPLPQRTMAPNEGHQGRLHIRTQAPTGWACQGYQKHGHDPERLPALQSPFYKVCGAPGTRSGAMLGLTSHSMGPWWPQHHVGWGAGLSRALAFWVCALPLDSDTGNIEEHDLKTGSPWSHFIS